jgi:hypothetical protein
LASREELEVFKVGANEALPKKKIS